MIGGKTDEGGHWRGLNTATTQKKRRRKPRIKIGIRNTASLQEGRFKNTNIAHDDVGFYSTKFCAKKNWAKLQQQSNPNIPHWGTENRRNGLKSPPQSASKNGQEWHKKQLVKSLFLYFIITEITVKFEMPIQGLTNLIDAIRQQPSYSIVLGSCAGAGWQFGSKGLSWDCTWKLTYRVAWRDLS